MAKADELSFRVKRPGAGYFFEGDVSEVSTLLDVDGDLVRACAEVIHEVSAAISRIRPDVFI